MKSLNQFFEKSFESAIKFIKLLQKQRQKENKTMKKNQTRKAFEKMFLQKSSKNEKTIVKIFFIMIEEFHKFFSNSLKQFLNTTNQHNTNDDLQVNQFLNCFFSKSIFAEEIIYYKFIEPKLRKIMNSNEPEKKTFFFSVSTIGLSREVFVQIADLINVYMSQTKRDLNAKNC